ncbi:MAG TPA: GH32 C-terminal domain-containing protein, partial [Psychromonas sp.]
RSIMSLPKEYSLVKNTAGQYVVAQKFAQQINTLFTPATLLSEDDFAAIEIKSPVYKLSGELSLLQGETGAIRLFAEQQAQITITAKGGELVVCSYRDYLGSNEVMQKEFPHNYQFKQPCATQAVAFELVVDNGAVELLLADGLLSMTQLYYPQQPNGNLSLSGQGWSQVALATCSHRIN